MKTIKLISVFFLSFLSLNAFAGYMPMPIFINSGGGGSLSAETALSVLIVCNAIFFLLYFIRSIIWFFKKERELFFDYVVWDRDYDMDYPIIVSIFFMIINGIALFVWLVEKVSYFL